MTLAITLSVIWLLFIIWPRRGTDGMAYTISNALGWVTLIPLALIWIVWGLVT